MESNYFLIKQTIPFVETESIKIYEPFNESHLKKLIFIMFGTVEVFKYINKNNSRVNLTNKYVNKKFDIYDYPFEKLYKISFTYKSKFIRDQHIKIFTIKDVFKEENRLPLKFYMFGTVFKRGSISCEYSLSGYLSSSIEDYKRKNNSGNEYEKFIALKYESKNYHVKLNGIKKGFDDGGLDLIAIKKDKIVLVQCKNWALSNNYKINQKDLRAFIGDCYLYLKDTDIKNRKVSFHFIVSHNHILTKSAQIFLDQNKFLKFKVIPFEL